MGPRRISRGNALVVWRRRALAGFNGAAADQPRKLELASGRRVAHRASMGPRRISRGNDLQGANLQGANLLQWGRGGSAAETRCSPSPRLWSSSFNGAAADQPRKRVRAWVAALDEGASMGPRRISRGNGRLARARLRVLHASMGPRRISRGNALSGQAQLARRDASMGPRRISRGNGRRSCVASWSWPSFNGAAADQPRKRWRCCSNSCRSGSFNGAAADQPRKQAERREPGLSGARFNGAAADQPRKPRRRTPDCPRRAGFNGAAADQPRKRRGPEGRGPEGRASMGPRRISRGNELFMVVI